MLEILSEDGLVMVELDNIGEGVDGDYDPTDEEDVPLMRFTLYRLCDDPNHEGIKDNFEGTGYEKNEWMAVKDGSYCTQLPVTSDNEILREAGQFLLDYVREGIRDYQFDKRLYESLSWITIKDGDVICNVGEWNV